MTQPGNKPRYPAYMAVALPSMLLTTHVTLISETFNDGPSLTKVPPNLNPNRMTVESERCTVDKGQWTVESGYWTEGGRQSTADS